MKKILGSYWVVLGLLVIGTATKLKAATASVHISESYFEGKTEYPDGSYLKVTTSWNESGQAVFYSLETNKEWSPEVKSVADLREARLTAKKTQKIYLFDSGYSDHATVSSDVGGELSQEEYTGSDFQPQAKSEMANYKDVIGSTGNRESRKAWNVSKLLIHGGVPGASYLVKVSFSALSSAVRTGVGTHGDLLNSPTLPLDSKMDRIACLDTICDEDTLSVTLWVQNDEVPVDVTPSWVGGNAHWAYDPSAVVLAEVLPEPKR